MREGWTYKKLNEVCDKSSSNIVINKLDDNNGDYPLFGASGLVKNVDFYHQDKPYIGIVKDGAGVGRVNTYPAYSSLVGTMQYIFPKEECLLNYVKYFLVKLDLSHCVSGATIPHIYFKDYGKELIPVPPLSTQLSIVSELDKISELIRLKKEQLKDYDNLAQSIFYEMFGDPVMNEKGWEVKKLGEVCTYPNKRISLSDITSYEYVGVETLVKNKGGVLFTEELPNAKNAIEYIENDILIGNIRPYLKKIWKSDRHGGASGDVVIIRISDSMKGLLTPVYLFKLLSTDEFFEYDNANTHGAKMPRGDRKAIGEFTIQIPPMHLQHIFAQRIELIEQQKAEIQSTIADLETLLASRMQYWFD